MNKYLIVFSIAILIFTSCSKNESISESPSIHDFIEIDIDDDGILDYKIKYSGVEIEPITLSDGVYGINASIQPYEQNEILRHKEEGILFLRNVDELDENVIEPLQWRSTFFSSIVSIATINAEGEWPNKWEVTSDTEYATYFLGLKLVTDFNTQLAWIEIDINTINGRISIVDKGIL